MRSKVCFAALALLLAAGSSAHAQRRLYSRAQFPARNPFQPPSTSELARGLKAGADSGATGSSLATSRVGVGVAIPRPSLTCPMPTLRPDSTARDRMPNLRRDTAAAPSAQARRAPCASPLRP